MPKGKNVNYQDMKAIYIVMVVGSLYAYVTVPPSNKRRNTEESRYFIIIPSIVISIRNYLSWPLDTTNIINVVYSWS